MTWEAVYDSGADTTTLRWTNGSTTTETTIDGWPNLWSEGLPATQTAQDAIATLIQEAGTPERIRMQFDLNLGFERVGPGQ